MNESKRRIPSAPWSQDQLDDATIIDPKPRLEREIAETFCVPEPDFTDAVMADLARIRDAWRMERYDRSTFKYEATSGIEKIGYRVTITLKTRGPT